MNRIEALAHFENNYVQAKVLEKILQAESYLWQNRDQLAAEFRESLRIIFIAFGALISGGPTLPRLICVTPTFGARIFAARNCYRRNFTELNLITQLLTRLP